MAAVVSLHPRACHVWYVSLDAGGDSDSDSGGGGGEAPAGWRALLDAGEAAELERLASARGRREYLAARALVRTTLSRYAPVPPERWSFAKEPQGRPRIVDPPTPDLHFSVSHTAGLVACAVARAPRVGLDVEDTTRPVEALRIAERFFAADEARALRALPPARQRDRFFELWTLKEAYAKAVGLGLALPLDRVAFDVAEDARVEPRARLRFDPRSDPRVVGDPAHWQLSLARLSERHLAAIAAERGSQPPFEISYFLAESTT